MLANANIYKPTQNLYISSFLSGLSRFATYLNLTNTSVLIK